MEPPRHAPQYDRPGSGRTTTSDERSPLLRRLLGAAICAGSLLLIAPPAQAVEPVRLGDSYVTDEAGALAAVDEAEANERLAAAYEETGIDLYVVLVDEFTDPSDRIDWANETADLNGLGESQYLLAVSTEGRQYFISGFDSGPLHDAQIEAIESKILPELRESDWFGAITTAAEQLEEEHAAAGRTGAIALGVGAGVIGIGGAATGVTLAVKRRRAKRTQAEELARLEQVSGSGLVAADDAVRTSAQELEFARAQFGDAAVEDFAAVLDTANAQLLEAFALRQRLDDAVPDTDEQRREWLQRIIELCEAVDAGLDAQASAFDELRAIEQNAPAALAALSTRRERAVEAGAAAEAELARLGSIYAPEELAALADSIPQASSLLAFAQDREAFARSALGETDTTDGGETDTADGGGTHATGSGAAAVAIREAEAAVAQAEALQSTISAHGEQLAGIEAQCSALIAELENDLAAARAMQDPDGSVAAAVQSTEQQVALAREALSGGGRRPTNALQALTAANTHIDGAVHTAQETARARQLFDANLAQAGEQVRQAESYIDARRGAVGATARTRISEAQAALARAIAAREADPRGAVAEVRRASTLASQALAEAQADVSGFGSGYGGGYGGGAYGGGTGGGVDLGAVLSGIFGYGGGGSYGGYGGSRSSWGGGGGGSRSSSRSSGSSRRSSGSSRRSSGGSRRSGGGGSRRSSGGGRF